MRFIALLKSSPLLLALKRKRIGRASDPLSSEFARLGGVECMGEYAVRQCDRELLRRLLYQNHGKGFALPVRQDDHSRTVIEDFELIFT